MTTADTEVPSLTMPRSELLAYAMATRMISGALRSSRESYGRAAWSDDLHGARRELAADAAAIDLLSPVQADEWNRLVGEGEVTTTRHDPAGMVVSHADLTDGTEVVQAVLGDRVVTVAAGSAETGQQVREWLADSPTHDRLSDLRAVAKDIAAERAAEGSVGGSDVAETAERSGDIPTADAGSAAERDEVGRLADRLDGRVPASVFDDPRWPMAEKRFATYVAAGADPDALADAVAGLEFSDKIRTPAGLVAWQLHRTMKGMKEPATEDQARREAAVEWLMTEAGDGPDDRARAARLIGHFDDAFDAQLAEKYPGLLNAADGQFHDHNGRSAYERGVRDHLDGTEPTSTVEQSALAAELADPAARADDGQLAVVAAPVSDTDPELTATATDHDVNEQERGLAADHDHAGADEHQYAQHAESDRTEAAAMAVHAAAAPLTVAGRSSAHPQQRSTAPLRPGRVPQQTKTNTRGRTR